MSKPKTPLTGKPFKITVDLLVLLTGFVPAGSTGDIAGMLGLVTGTDGFINSADSHIMNNSTDIPGVFVAGAVKGPISIGEAIADARAAAIQLAIYLNSPTPADD